LTMVEVVWVIIILCLATNIICCVLPRNNNI
jgi:hypothetical protein